MALELSPHQTLRRATARSQHAGTVRYPHLLRCFPTPKKLFLSSFRTDILHASHVTLLLCWSDEAQCWRPTADTQLQVTSVVLPRGADSSANSHACPRIPRLQIKLIDELKTKIKCNVKKSCVKSSSLGDSCIRPLMQKEGDNRTSIGSVKTKSQLITHRSKTDLNSSEMFLYPTELFFSLRKISTCITVQPEHCWKAIPAVGSPFPPHPPGPGC